MFMSGVAPILDYSSTVWGYPEIPKIDTIQYRAMRIFLGSINMRRIWQYPVTWDGPLTEFDAT